MNSAIATKHELKYIIVNIQAGKRCESWNKLIEVWNQNWNSRLTSGLRVSDWWFCLFLPLVLRANYPKLFHSVRILMIRSVSIQFGDNHFRFYSITARKKLIISVSVRTELNLIISVRVYVPVHWNITAPKGRVWVRRRLIYKRLFY